MKTPIVFGIKCQDDLDEITLKTCCDILKKELIKLRKEYPHTEIVVLTSLSSASELTCCETTEKLGLRHECILPMNVDEMRQYYEGSESRLFEELIASASAVSVVDVTENMLILCGRNYVFEKAAKEIASYSHVLFAVRQPGMTDFRSWTSSAMESFNEGHYCGRYDRFRRDGNGTLLFVELPIHNDVPEIIENSEGCYHKLLSETDEYNAKVEDHFDIVDFIQNEPIGNELFRALESTNSVTILEKALPGKSPYHIVERIAALLHIDMTEYLLAYPELIKEIQKQHLHYSQELLEEIYQNKHGYVFNKGKWMSKYELDNQIWNENDDIAFQNVSEDDFDRLYIDLDNDRSLDEFEYIDARFYNQDLKSRKYDYYKWRFNKLCEIDLLA